MSSDKHNGERLVTRMQFPFWRQATSALHTDAVFLGALNLTLAVLCGIIFFSVISGVMVLTLWLQSYSGNPGLFVPFPAPVLLVLYVIVFILAWVLFARGLKPRSTSRAVRTGFLGAIPLFALSLLGYLGVAWLLVTGDFGADSMLEASVFIYGFLSTLILCAGLICTAIVALFSPRPITAS